VKARLNLEDKIDKLSKGDKLKYLSEKQIF
jgi:hypothetical protein